MSQMKALEVNTTPTFSVQVTTLPIPEIQSGEVLVQVDYSAVNYKDALAQIPKGGVIRNYPMIPGIDLAGMIVKSHEEKYPVGLPVLVTGFGLGVSHPGGFSQYQVIPCEWLVPLPENLSPKDAMIIGTAGFTAALAVTAVTKDLPKEAAILVTGATGGVASLAIGLLNAWGYQNITAVTRKTPPTWLKNQTGALLNPEDLALDKPRPLAKQRYLGVIDTVGGEILTDILPQIAYGGVVALCGNAAGISLNTTVLPFILRGVTLKGIDSVNVPQNLRPELWQKLADLGAFWQENSVTEISLAEIPTTAEKLLAAKHLGRTIVKVRD